MQASKGFGEIHEWAPRAPLRCSLTFTHSGLTLGRGTSLTGFTKGTTRLAIEGEEERILALLSAALNKAVPARAIENLRCASEQWARGDKCLAHLHLAFAGLPRIDEDGATRLALADEALAKGASPRALLKTLGLNSAQLDALKFNPGQPRVPSGSGRESGRWTSGDGSAASAGIIPVSEIEHEGQHPEGDPKDNSYEERRALGLETPDEDIKHGHPIDPLQTPTIPVVGPPSKSVLIGNNAKSGSGDRTNSDLPGGLSEAQALFESLTKGQGSNTFVARDGVTITRSDDGTHLRIMPDGSVRIERQIAIGGKRREIIHFNSN